MPIDASIPLQARPPKLPTALEVMTLKDLATRSQINEQNLQEKQMEVQKKNSLLQLMQSPEVTDPNSGMLTPQGIAQITKIDPQLGMTLGHQNQQMTLQNIAMQEKRSALKAEILSSYVSLYDHYRQTLGDPEVAEKRAREESKSMIEEGKNSGRYIGYGIGNDELTHDLPAPELARRAVTIMGGKAPEPPKQEHIVSSNKESSTGLAFFDPRTKSFLKGDDGKIIPAPPTLQASMANVQIPEEDKKFWADIIRKGGTLPPGLARSGVGAKLVSEVMQEVPKGNTQPADVIANQAELAGIKAGQRTIGTKQAQIEMAVTEAKNMAPLALQASNAVDRTKYPTLNSFLLAAEKGTGDENVVRLGVATNSLINIYARAINPTGVATVSDKDHARELLAAAWSKGQYAAGVDQLMKELAAAQKSPSQVRGAMREALTGKKGEESTPKNDWVERAMKANPGMSREEIEAEGKRRNKL